MCHKQRIKSHAWQYLTITRLCVALCSFLTGVPLLAATASSQSTRHQTNAAPIDVKAQSIHYDNEHNYSFLKGHVVMDQGRAHLKSETMQIFFNENHQVKKLIAHGHPAHYTKDPVDKGQRLNADAKTIRYSPEDQTVELIGQALVTQGQNRFKSHAIFYNIKAGTVRSKGSEHARSVLHINPPDWRKS